KIDLHLSMQKIGERARDAYRILSTASVEQKNEALIESSRAIRRNVQKILGANESDMILAREAGLNEALLDRLKLNATRIEAMAKGLKEVAAFLDPVGKILAQWERPNGLRIERVSVPLGVIGIIYESRPNVTADAGGLCLKSGNAAILRGGSDSFHSSKAIVECLHTGLNAADLPVEAVQLVPTRDRAAVGEMLNMTGLIDIIVPRGGKSLTERILRESRIPTIQHLDGNCHTYIHSSADVQMAKEVLLNAKMRRTGICGATESLLIDQSITDKLLPELLERLFAAGCEIRGDEEIQAFDSRIIAASDEDWATEYLDSILSVKTVKNFAEAIRHINLYGSHHTDAIIAEDAAAAQAFLNEVDSAIVLHNASTQFADGGEFGMGVEIGISTGRLHARGPVGVEQLTTYKYIVRGNGQIRQ
ncbi:MAG TPA: glutamate-5-semialdehyde dehydrogenase, partial [Pyrinomonadaceae bacterium]